MLQFSNVLCPIDFSETSARALTYAAALAQWYDAHLEVLHVVPALEAEGDEAQGDGPEENGLAPLRGSRGQLSERIERAIATAGASTWTQRISSNHHRSTHVTRRYSRIVDDGSG